VDQTSFKARPYAGDADLKKISKLLSECESIDMMGLRRTPDELRVQFSDPSLNTELDTRLWEAPRRKLAGYALLDIEMGARIDATLRWRIHPNYRADWLDDDVIQWGEEQMRQLAAEKGLPARIQSVARDIDRPRQFMLEWHDYNVIHELWQMERNLHQPIDHPQLPEGFSVRAAIPEQDADAWIAMYNESFIDHWDHVDLTREAYFHRRQNDPGYARERDLIVIAPDGQFAAFCWSFINPDEISRARTKQALLQQIGTRRGYRNLGLGRAILCQTLQTLRDQGMDSVRLYVYTDNKLGAQKLYEDAGFTKSFSLVTYAKALTEGAALKP